MYKSIARPLSRLLCTISSYSPVIMFYLTQDILTTGSGIEMYLQIGAIIFLFICCLTLAIMTRDIAERNADSDHAKIQTIHPIENNAIPTYIGLFVISLGISEIAPSGTAFILFMLFIVWSRFEKVCYFNLFWSILGWNFYEFQTEEGGPYFLISREKDLKHGGELSNLKRINNYTFMEVNQ